MFTLAPVPIGALNTSPVTAVSITAASLKYTRQVNIRIVVISGAYLVPWSMARFASNSPASKHPPIMNTCIPSGEGDLGVKGLSNS